MTRSRTPRRLLDLTRLEDRTTPSDFSLFPRLPDGSLIYDGEATAIITGPADADEFTLTLDVNQTIAVEVSPNPLPTSFRPTIEVFAPDGSSLGQAPVPPAGFGAILQAVQATAAGTYRVVVGSFAGSGSATVRVTLNAALELEQRASGAPSNNTLANAEDIDGMFTILQAGPTVARRAAVFGVAEGAGSAVTNGGFEFGDFTGWTTEITGNPFAPWFVTQAGNGTGFFPPTQPQEGQWAAWNGFAGEGPMEYRLSQVVTLPNSTVLTLSWKDRIQWDSSFIPGEAAPHTYAVELLNPATNVLLATVYSFSTGPESANPAGDTGWVSHAADLTAFAGQTVRLRFRETIPEPFALLGQFELDAVSIPFDVPDHYRLTLAAGERVSVGVKGQTDNRPPSGGTAVALLDAAGNVVASGTSATNLDGVINNVAVPSAGTYYLRVTGATPTRYGLVVTRDAALDAEPNDTPAAAQPLGPRGALGAITAGAGMTPAVTPGALAAAEGNQFGVPFRSGIRTQQIVARSEFPAGPTVIDAIRFRRDASFPTFPPLLGNVTLRVGLAYAATTVAAPSATFADNIGAGYTVVLDGRINLSSSASGSPNPFDLVLDLADRFTYDPALGDLLLDIQVTFAQQPSGLPIAVDASGGGQQSVVNTVTGSLTGTAGTVAAVPFGLVTRFDRLAPQTDDWYSVDVTEIGNPLVFRTATPAGGPGEFANVLNPRIELYDPAGTLVAAGVTGPDGRNETLTHAPLVAGTYRVRVLGEDVSRGEYFLARNTAPAAGPVNGPTPSPGVRGQELHFSGSFADPDEFDSHEASWDFGDGTVTPFTPATAAALAPTHTYAAAGTFTVTMRVRDGDGGAAAGSRTVTIQAVALQDDPVNPGKTALAVGGTGGHDLIVFTPGGPDGRVSVFVNGAYQGTFQPSGRLIAFGQGGNDIILVADNISVPAWLYGGAGNDILRGGRGPSLLLGGAGNDLLSGGPGRSVMIGGTGNDLMTGGSGDDLMIGGTTAFDGDEAALNGILLEWSAPRPGAVRRANLSGTAPGPRLNGSYFLTPGTVFDDEESDILLGGSGFNWIWVGDGDWAFGGD